MRAIIPFVAVCAFVGLTACGPKPPAAAASEAVRANAAASEYLAPPTPQSIERRGQDLILIGSAPVQSQVRLATPRGQVVVAQTDGKGEWRMPLGALPRPQVFGLSVVHKGRLAQAQGYVLLTPNGQGALLRAGSAAVRIDQPAGSGFRALDFDREGGAAISATVAPDASVVLRVDGLQVATGRAGPSGRFEIAVPTPLTPGVHRLQILSDGVGDALSVQVSSPAPLVQGPMRSQLTPAGLRVDWMTPGGGVQSTILVH